MSFNDRLATLITKAVGSMYCAYAFALLALISLPDAIQSGRAAVISWIAQTFLQLVLLSVILVGQSLQNRQLDAHHARLEDLHDKHDALAQKVSGS